LNISENSRDLDIAHVYVNDTENDNYNCSVITDNGLLDYEPFEITDGILRTSSVVNDYCESKSQIRLISIVVFKIMILISKQILSII